MRYTAKLIVLVAFGVVGVITGCDDDDDGAGGAGGQGTTTTGTGGNGTGGMGTTTGTGGNGTGGMGTGGMGTGGTGGGGMGIPVNGCDPATAMDMTNQAMVTITFGGALGNNYSPKCVRVSPGTAVTFSGDFVSHPLDAGSIVGNMPMEDPGSPITETNMGMTATFNFPNAGTYPYYCEVHWPTGMTGAVYVQ